MIVTSKEPALRVLPYVIRFEPTTAIGMYTVLGTIFIVVEGIDWFTNGFAALLHPNQVVVAGFFTVLFITFSWLVWASRIELTQERLTWSMKPLQRQSIRWENIQSARLVTYGSDEARRVGYRGPGVAAIVLYPRDHNDVFVRIVPKFFSTTDLHQLAIQIRNRSPDVKFDRHVERLTDSTQAKNPLMAMQVRGMVLVISVLMTLFVIIGLIRSFG